MTDQTTHTNFLGIPVEGDITKSGRSNVVQRPVEEFGPILQAVLDDPLFAAVCWEQYTPYFNDGDPCEFRIGTPWFVTTQDDENNEDADAEDLGVDYGKHPTLGIRDYDYVAGRRVDKGYVGEHEASYDRACALNGALNGGAFEDVLLDAFGDHAKIRVTRERIEVEFYEHD